MGHLFRIEILIMSLQCVENQQLQIFLWDEGVVVKKIMQVYEVEPNYTKGKKLVFYLNEFCNSGSIEMEIKATLFSPRVRQKDLTEQVSIGNIQQTNKKCLKGAR